MQKKGTADLPLHYGRVPAWLSDRMALLGGAIAEAIVMEYGRSAFLQKISDPFWFQSLGCVLGMDWHSSGITTSVMGALKRSVNERAGSLGIFICGGRGKYSRQTPDELLRIGERTGVDARQMIYNSRLAAKVDNTAIQDGFQLYLHNFIVTREGEWAVIQQGMNPGERMARRYHWHSVAMPSFLETPHTYVYGKSQGKIINLTDKKAAPAKQAILEIIRENPERVAREIKKLVMPRHHEVTLKEVHQKRLGAVLAIAHHQPPQDMESLLLLNGVGPRTIQSLVLVSEVIYGTPSRFDDPARFSFAHGGKDGHPFPVPTKVYDEAIAVLDKALERARLNKQDKMYAFKNLTKAAQQIEQQFHTNDKLPELIEKERKDAWKYGGRTIHGLAKRPQATQMELF